MDDPILLARIQFAANISFHILFPTITIALGWVLLFFKLRFNRTGDAAWMESSVPSRILRPQLRHGWWHHDSCHDFRPKAQGVGAPGRDDVDRAQGGRHAVRQGVEVPGDLRRRRRDRCRGLPGQTPRRLRARRSRSRDGAPPRRWPRAAWPTSSRPSDCGSWARSRPPSAALARTPPPGRRDPGPPRPATGTSLHAELLGDRAQARVGSRSGTQMARPALPESARWRRAPSGRPRPPRHGRPEPCQTPCRPAGAREPVRPGSHALLVIQVHQAVRRREHARDPLLDALAQSRLRRLWRHVHAQVDDRQSGRRDLLPIRDPSPHVAAAPCVGLDQPHPARLVEGAGDGGEVDPKLLRELALRRQAVAGLEAAGLHVGQQGLGDGPVLRPVPLLELRHPGQHVSLTFLSCTCTDRLRPTYCAYEAAANRNRIELGQANLGRQFTSVCMDRQSIHNRALLGCRGPDRKETT